MSTITKRFECEVCGAEGKITLDSEDLVKDDMVYCPVCSADISEEDR